MRRVLPALVLGAVLLGLLAAPAAAESGTVTMRDAIADLDQALTRLQAGDAPGAATAVKTFQRHWVDVEGQVKTRSPKTYTETENDMALAYSLLTQSSPDTAGARAVVERMRTALVPYIEEARYGIFDAAIILLREGLEALLVITALLAFLSKTGNGARGVWIWAGGGAGIALSLIVAFAANIIFTAAGAGSRRELVEGVVGLFAAAMLIYMSYWLHSKSNLSAWHKYIRDKSSSALARNSLFSLALISFLAVFREGAETVLFYLGIASSISVGDLVAGLGVGAAGLAVIGAAMLVFGLKLPVRLFFTVAGVLVFYLAVKFTGSGVHALQVADVVPATSGPLPENAFFGLYPTWESTLPQLVLLVGAATLLLRDRFRGRTHGAVTGGAQAG